MRAQSARSEQVTAVLGGNGLSWLAAAVTIISWASAFAGIRVGLEGYSPYSLALLRYAVASVLLIGFVVWRRIPLPDWQDVPR